MGGLGGVYIDDTEVHTPPDGLVIVAIFAEKDTVVAASTSNITNLDGFSIAAEGQRPGRFTSIQLTSGIATAYYGV